MYVCILGLVIASYLLRSTLQSVAYLAVPYSSTLSHKLHDFRENYTEHKTFLFETFLIPTITRRDITINLHSSLCRNPLCLSVFSETWILSTDFWKILKYQMSWTCVHLEPNCSMRTDRQDVANSHSFANLQTILKKSRWFCGVSWEPLYWFWVKCYVGSPRATRKRTKIFKLWIYFLTLYALHGYGCFVLECPSDLSLSYTLAYSNVYIAWPYKLEIVGVSI